jgi:hypothetical protein
MKLKEKKLIKKKEKKLNQRQTRLTRQTWDSCHESVITTYIFFNINKLKRKKRLIKKKKTEKKTTKKPITKSISLFTVDCTMQSTLKGWSPLVIVNYTFFWWVKP